MIKTLLILNLIWFMQIGLFAQAGFLDTLLTPQEINWLNNNKYNINYAPNPSWPPGDYVDEEGIHKGFVTDYINIFENALDVNFNRVYFQNWNDILKGLKTTDVDFVGAIHRNDERDEYLLFTDPFITIPLVILVRNDYPLELTNERISEMSLACVSGYSSTEYIINEFPNARIFEYEDDLSAILKTSFGNTDGTVIDLMAASYIIEKYGITNLAMAFELDFSWKLRFGCRKDMPELQSILNKVLNTIDENQRRNIYNKFVKIDYAKAPGFIEQHKQIMIIIQIIFVVSIILFLINVIVLRKQVKKRTLELNNELKTSEENKEFRKRVFDSSNMPIVVLDALSCKFIDCNNAAASIYSYQSTEDVIGKTPVDVSAPNQYDGTPSIEKAKYYIDLAINKGAVNYEWKHQRPNGEIWDAEVHLLSFKNDDRQLLQFSLTDITEKKKSEEEIALKDNLEKRIAIAEESLKFKQKFLSNMSHEIRTPISGVLGMAELLSKTKLNKTQTEYISNLKISGKNLLDIINQVLDFSKIEAGKIDLKKQVFRFESILINAENMFNSICNKPILFEKYTDPKLPEFINADEARITQIINNLISNAVKFTEKGLVTLKAELFQKSNSSNSIVIKFSVSDTGIGIAKELQKKLFTPFYQIDENNIGSREGSGLGLSICKELANLHGGEVGLESEINEGSTFWFTIMAEVGNQEIEKSIEKSSRHLDQKHSLKILLAEDNIANQKVFKSSFTYLGHDVTIANNGQEVIDLFQPEKFDLILMDIKMPVMDGITATNILRKKYKVLPPIIGLSANAFEGDKERYMKEGLDEYLTKPLNLTDFKEVIRKLFG
jgi:two-component system, NarL family, sensor histidine kinase EvgS